MRHIDGTPVRITRRLSLTLLLLLCGSLSNTAHAQTNTWTGQGTDDNWSTAGNWNSNGVPVSAATTGLDFTGSAATSNNDLGTFQLNLLQFDVAADLTLSGNDLDFVSTGTTTPVLTQNKGFAVTINNNLTLTNNLTVNLAGSGNINLNGVLSGAGSLTISGNHAAYTTVLANSGNSYGGDTIVTGGTLQLGADNALTSGNDLSLTGTTAAATLDLNGHAATVGNINFADGTANSANNLTIADSSSGATGLLTLNGNINYAPGFSNVSGFITPTAYINSNLALSAGQHVIDYSNTGSFSAGNYDVIIGGAISGSGGLDIGSVNDTSTGLFTALAHANTYTGPTNIINGGLFLGATNALPAGSTVTLGASGSLYLYVASGYTETGLTVGSYNQSIGSLADNVSSSGGKVYLGSATLTVGSNNASTTFSGTIQDTDDATATMGNLVKVGTGTLTLSGNSTYTGSTTINNGTLQLGISDALPDTNTPDAVNTNLTLNGGNFDTNANGQTVNNLTNQGGNVLVQGGGSVLNVDGAYTQSAGTTQVDQTLNLTPTTTIPGDLSITGGQLVGTGTIGNAATSGTVTVTNSGGTVQPGDILSTIGTPLAAPTIGTLTINGNYTQTSGGTLQINLASGTSYDQLVVVSNASLAGTLNVKLLNGFVPTTGETFNFLTYGTVSGGFNSIIAQDPGYIDTVAFVNGEGILTITAVPESSTLLSATTLLGLGGLLLRRRSGNRKDRAYGQGENHAIQV
jgi:fibronectin-binding autotransporter adhesin